MTEKWRPVADPLYAEFYEVSNMGRVRSLRKNSTCRHENKILTPINHSVGYRRCQLVDCNGISKTKYIHTLVAAAFIGPNGDKEVNHKDLDKSNNKLSNLEYVTRSENIKHAMNIKGPWQFFVKGHPPYLSKNKTRDAVYENRKRKVS